MKKKGLIYFNKILAGEIRETDDGDFVFQYNQNYLKSENPQPISYSIKLQKEEFTSQYLKGFFDGLLPEGWILNLAIDHWKFHPIKDRYNLLLKTCFDPVGAVSIREEGRISPDDSAIKPPTNTDCTELNLQKCLYCYEELSTGTYHSKCSQDFFNSDQPPQINLNNEIIKELGKISVSNGLTIPGVQKKISLDHLFNSRENRLTLTHYAGRYILKPKGTIPHLPENEDLIIKLAKNYGIPVAKTAMIALQNGDFALLSQRIDRSKDGTKLHMEDFCQILDQVTDKKYIGSYQKVGKLLRDYCSGNAPQDQVLKLYELILFSYIVGNADLHLKNISVLHNPWPSLSPAYDLLSFEIFQEDFKERDNDIMALAINGKKNKLEKVDFDILADSFQIKPKVRNYIYKKFQNQKSSWFKLIEKSFLSDHKKVSLRRLIEERLDHVTGKRL